MLRFIGKNGEPVVMLLDLAELDLKDSVDGSSPDAQCIFKCYERALDELDKRLGQHLNGGTWRKALVNSSLDGASVNLGQHRGVGKLLGDAVPMQVTLHAAAHIVQLCVSDVFELCEYHVVFKELIARLCREYSKSGKRKKNLEELAKQIIGAKAFKLHGVHGIRWVASIRNVLAKVYRMLHLIVIDLDERAKFGFGGRARTMRTSDEMFIGVTFTHPDKEVKYKVTAVATPSSTASDPPASDSAVAISLFHAKPALKKHGVDEIVVTKLQLVQWLGDSDDIEKWQECAKCKKIVFSERCEKCKAFSLWELKCQVQSERFVRHLAFMIDLHEELQAVSICFQADSVTIADVAQRVGFAINAIKKRATICGDIESAVHRYITTGKGPWEQGSLQIVRCSPEELSEHNQDREGICDDLAGSFNIRYLTALSDPIVKALRVLDTSRWPVYKQQDTAELDAYGNDDISQLVDNYRVFFEDTTGAKVLAQWERMKQTIASDPQLSRMEFNVLWPRMLSRSGFVKQFSLVLRIVGIAVTFTVDTSGCERLISLMNDLKTKFQERMGHEYLRDLVWWHKSKRLLSHAEWEAALGRTLVRWSQAGHRRHQVHTQLSPGTIQLVSARDDGPDDDGETVPADSYQDLCKLAEL